MDIVHFLGFILPNNPIISIAGHPKMRMTAPEIGVDLLYTVDITNSKIDITCEVEPRYRDELLIELRMRALDICRAAVNLVAFSGGLGLMTVLDTFVDTVGNPTVVTIANPKLAAACTSFSAATFEDVHKFVREDIHLSVLLNDLIMAQTMTHTAQINCARVIDGLKNRIAPGLKDKAAWAKFQETLNLGEDYLKFISKRSSDPRHGQLPIVTREEAGEIILRAWTVMNRYFEYLKGGSIKLESATYPVLI